MRSSRIRDRAPESPEEFAAFLKTLDLRELIDLYREFQGLEDAERCEIVRKELQLQARAASDRSGRKWGKNGIRGHDGQGRP